jgi:hypothetical protein
MGLQIVYLALCFVGGIGLCALGFKRASDAAEDTEQRDWRRRIRCAGWLGCYLGGGFLAAWGIASSLSLWG